jgi:hypothetical protein
LMPSTLGAWVVVVVGARVAHGMANPDNGPSSPAAT